MSISKTFISDKLYLTGVILVAVSTLFFCLPFFSQLQSASYLPLFFVNFIITVAYFIILWANGKLRKGREGMYHMLLFLVLFLISAYSLNREIPVFESSVSWFSFLLVLCCVNFIAFRFVDHFPDWLKHTMSFVLGISLMIFLYLTIYLMPLYIIGTMALLILGISLHTFLPILFSIYSIRLINKISRSRKALLLSFSGGILTVLSITIVFTAQWSVTTKQINRIFRTSTAFENNGLPGWVAVSQVVSHNWITELILKSDLVYSTSNEMQESWFWRMPSRNSFNEESKHDPLVMTASFFAGKPNLDEQDRIKILESIYDSRHQAQERLWSGENLFTENVNTSVKIWPQFAMAYTEKLITVSNFSNLKGWSDQDEAIYTFHLPEGGVVTSLSLWIDGKEAKGILTTKEKAALAYRTIVGYERRDPSLVQWQEGNTVSVRVFPVIAGQSRVFKIGITSPLEKQVGKLGYQNIYFDGPSAANATENVTIRFEKKPEHFIQLASFTSENNQVFKSSGKYKADWKIAIDEETLSTQRFNFDGRSYFVRPYQKQRTDVRIQSIFLDINKSWTEKEFQQLFRSVENQNVYVYHNEMVLLTDENKEEEFRYLSKNQFSLFPLQEIKEPEHSLVVSKSPPLSPNLHDLKDSRFFREMQEYLKSNHKIRLFNLGTELSPYLKSLKEYRVFNYEHGSVNDLEKLLATRQFATDIENDGLVVIDNAEIAIGSSPEKSSSTAPDHLMRLFAYNHILQKAGRELLTSDSLKSELVEESKKAYVVTPVSSLVVLETQADYDRFKIESADKSLQNASSNGLQSASRRGTGAVPEPHEWALIIIAILLLFVLKFQPKLRIGK